MGTTRDYTILLKVRADLQDALGKIGNVDKSLSHLKRTGLELAGALGIGFSVAGLVDFVKNTIAADQQIGNLAKTLGTSTEQLSALQTEARKAGVDIGSLQGALVALSRGATGQNAQGTSALKAMGIDAHDAAGNLKPIPQLLQEVSSKFAGYEDGTGKVALATAVFGKSGAQLIPLLDQIGNEGLDNITKKAVEAGTAISSEAVKASNDFANALDDLKGKLQGAVNHGLEEFTPQIETLAEKVDDPQFQKALFNTADGIVAISVAAANSISHLATFISDMQAIVGFRLDGNIDSGASLDLQQSLIDQKQKQLDTLNADLDARTSGFMTRGIKSQVVMGKQGVADVLDNVGNPVGLALDIAGTLTTAGASTEKLKAARDKLAAEIAADKAQLEDAKAKEFTATHFEHGTPMVPDADGKTKPPGGGGNGNGNATDNAKAYAAALAHLQDQLGTLRTQGLDPTAEAWAKYNKTVDDAVAEAAKAGNTPEANAALNGIVQQAARLRDVDLAKIADDDRTAYEQLKQSLETPAETHLDQALDQIAQLNGFLQRGVINARQYNDAVKRIGQGVVQAGPRLRDLGEPSIQRGLENNFGQQSDENRVHAENLKNLQAFYSKQQNMQAQFDAAMEAEKKRHEQALLTITTNRTEMELAAASEGFGQLAEIAGNAYGKQSTAYKVLFDLSKAFAIAQAAVSLALNISKASEIGFPYNIPMIAGAIAQGVEIVSIIAGANFNGGGGGASAGGGGYAEGGYTGAGGKYQPAGIVHAGEVVFSQADVQRHGGVHAVESMRLGLPGYADGGFVAPTPAQLGFSSPRRPRADFGGGGGRGAPQPISLKSVLVLDKEVIPNAMSGADGSRVTMAHIKANIPTIRAWVNGKRS